MARQATKSRRQQINHVGSIKLAQAVWLYLFDPYMNSVQIEKVSGIADRTLRRYARIARTRSAKYAHTGVIWKWSESNSTIPPWPVARNTGQEKLVPTAFARLFINGGRIPSKFQKRTWKPPASFCTKSSKSQLKILAEKKENERCSKVPPKKMCAQIVQTQTTSRGSLKITIGPVPFGSSKPQMIDITGPISHLVDDWNFVRVVHDNPEPPTFSDADWSVPEVSPNLRILPFLTTFDGGHFLVCGGNSQRLFENLNATDASLVRDVLLL